ncbi:MAG: hypothetical protein M1814_006366 [Vezdaea aestivalis]|nr:MAG: hypothetical protein M1814_006366 [Vezdaea aestivalis]
MTMLDHHQATNDQIAAACKSLTNSVEDVLGGSRHGNLVVRLAPGIVVKFGLGVTFEEYENQRWARRHLNPNIVYVPRVFRFFEEKRDRFMTIGYIIMELVEGHNLASLDLQDKVDIATKVGNALKHMATHIRKVPGPVGGGEPQGYLWSEYGPGTSFSTSAEMESWFNDKLKAPWGQIQLQKADLQFCHLDLARRNLILRPDGSISLLDWASAGFYPKIFEVWCLRMLPFSDNDFASNILRTMGELTEEETATIDLLDAAQAFAQRFAP